MKAIVVLVCLSPLLAAAAGPAAAPTPYDAARAAAQVQKIVAGLGEKAALPANQAFGDITISPTSSVERYLRIMDEGFSRSLGVDCTWCHDPADWSRDSAGKFAVTRAMWTMVYRINQDDLRKMPDVDRKARVNCATCHRGELKPAQNLD
ncbi:MAG TPA: photosynthetic reaction center cytochrome c subunit family protein [Candidatus Krumholzibacteria bacterium]|nr:photosynthetic reaction center cytochrome c subunit family protein [Candidatus Krumholzibacteria bacterium]